MKYGQRPRNREDGVEMGMTSIPQHGDDGLWFSSFIMGWLLMYIPPLFFLMNRKNNELSFCQMIMRTMEVFFFCKWLGSP